LIKDRIGVPKGNFNVIKCGRSGFVSGVGKIVQGWLMPFGEASHIKMGKNNLGNRKLGVT